MKVGDNAYTLTKFTVTPLNGLSTITKAHVFEGLVGSGYPRPDTSRKQDKALCGFSKSKHEIKLTMILVSGVDERGALRETVRTSQTVCEICEATLFGRFQNKYRPKSTNESMALEQ